LCLFYFGARAAENKNEEALGDFRSQGLGTVDWNTSAVHHLIDWNFGVVPSLVDGRWYHHNHLGMVKIAIPLQRTATSR